MFTAQVLSYLDAFADHYNLKPLIRFETQVVRVTPLEGAAPAAAAADGTACWQQRRWLVEARRLGRAGGVEGGADGGADITSEVFDAVMVGGRAGDWFIACTDRCGVACVALDYALIACCRWCVPKAWECDPRPLTRVRVNEQQQLVS
jgi:hypothetical protein